MYSSTSKLIWTLDSRGLFLFFFPILLCSHNRLNPWPCDWTPSLWPSSPQRLAALSCLKPKSSNYMIDLSGITNAWFKVISLAQTQLWSKGSNWGNSYNWGNFKGSEALSLEVETKTRQAFFFFLNCKTDSFYKCASILLRIFVSVFTREW